MTLLERERESKLLFDVKGKRFHVVNTSSPLRNIFIIYQKLSRNSCGGCVPRGSCVPSHLPAEILRGSCVPNHLQNYTEILFFKPLLQRKAFKFQLTLLAKERESFTRKRETKFLAPKFLVTDSQLMITNFISLSLTIHDSPHE